MSDNYELDGVDLTPTANLMKEIQDKVTELRELEWKMIQAEEVFKKATDAYEEFSRKMLPDLFRMNGLTAVQTEDGCRVQVTTKTTCSINKNTEDKAAVVKWLRDHQGGDLVKSQCIVPVSQIERLKEAGIIFAEETTMNTNSVKAWLLDQLGQKGSVATITKEDIPHGINFFQYDEMEVIHK